MQLLLYSIMSGSEELRKASGALEFIGSLLDLDEGWKVVMSYIPKDLNTDNYLRSDQYERKYNDEHIRLIQDHAERAKRSFTNVLFEEWGSSGRTRPTLHTLMAVLTKAQMFRAADHLADVLKVPHPPRPIDGPGAAIDVTGYLQNITTSEISPETRMLPNGATNGTEDAVHRGPTRQLEQSVNLMQFSHNIIPDTIPLTVLGEQRTTEMPNNNQNFNERSDMMRFSHQQLSSEEYVPRFDLMNNKSNNNSVSNISVTSGHSDISSSSQQSATTSHNLNEISQISNNNFDMQAVNEPLKWIIDQVHVDVTKDSSLTNFKYSDLNAITENFKYIIGSGGFGDVFKGNHEMHGLLAIKKSHTTSAIMNEETIMKIFNTEIISLSALRHQNIVHILGYSIDGASPCIVCEYIEGGSLLEYLKVPEKRRNLNTSLRMNIMIGTADGLKHIHSTQKPASTIAGTQNMNTYRKQYFVHGDVKSANILITRDFVPKICDLGLSKQCAATHHTQSIMGTTAYMSHERLSGTITPKGDTYSYGIVLMELLTGLPPTEIEGADGAYDIKTFVSEMCKDGNIDTLLDKEVGEWPEAQRIFKLAILCTKHDRVKRPTFIEICETLQAINTMS